MIGFSALSKWTIGLLPIRDWLWLGLVVALVSYHEITLSVAHHNGHTEAQTQCTADRNKAEVIALRDWIGVDDWLRNAAATQTALTTQQLTQTQAKLAQLQTDYHTHANTHPLPAACVLDAERVRRANAAIADGTP